MSTKQFLFKCFMTFVTDTQHSERKKKRRKKKNLKPKNFQQTTLREMFDDVYFSFGCMKQEYFELTLIFL